MSEPSLSASTNGLVAEPSLSPPANSIGIAAVPMQECLNCDATVEAVYCGACGQRVVDLEAPTWVFVRPVRPARTACLRLLYAAGLGAILLGCTGGPVGEDTRLPSGFESIYGRWTWVRSCCGISGTPQTPESAGYTMDMVFGRPDILRVYRNAELVTTTAFVVQVERRAGRTVAFLTQTPGPGVIEIRLRADTLELVPGCADCPADRFERAATASVPQ